MTGHGNGGLAGLRSREDSSAHWQPMKKVVDSSFSVGWLTAGKAPAILPPLRLLLWMSPQGNALPVTGPFDRVPASVFSVCVDAVPVLIEADSPDSVREGVRAARLQPPDDVHASSEYRAHLAEVLAERAARQAVGA